MMESIFNKLEIFFERIKRMNVFKFFLIMFVINFAWIVFISIILYFSGAQFSQHVASTSEFTNSFLLVPFAAVAEEVVFRWGPMIILSFCLTYAYRTERLTKDQFFMKEKYCLFVLVIVSSSIFGYFHGNFYNILIQGVSGLFMYVVYLRSFFIERDLGVRDRWQVVPLLESSIYHFLVNSFLIFL